MSERMTRRGLLRGLVDSLREQAPEKPPQRVAQGFSLEAFYAEREAPPRELPVVVVRSGLPRVATTDVGVCPAIEEQGDNGRLS